MLQIKEFLILCFCLEFWEKKNPQFSQMASAKAVLAWGTAGCAWGALLHGSCRVWDVSALLSSGALGAGALPHLHFLHPAARDAVWDCSIQQQVQPPPHPALGRETVWKNCV